MSSSKHFNYMLLPPKWIYGYTSNPSKKSRFIYEIKSFTIYTVSFLSILKIILFILYFAYYGHFAVIFNPEYSQLAVLPGISIFGTNITPL